MILNKAYLTFNKKTSYYRSCLFHVVLGFVSTHFGRQLLHSSDMNMPKAYQSEL